MPVTHPLDVSDEARQRSQATAPQGMGRAVEDQRMDARVAQHHLEGRARRRVAVEHRRDIILQAFEHRRGSLFSRAAVAAIFSICLQIPRSRSTSGDFEPRPRQQSPQPRHQPLRLGRIEIADGDQRLLEMGMQSLDRRVIRIGPRRAPGGARPGPPRPVRQHHLLAQREGDDLRRLRQVQRRIVRIGGDADQLLAQRHLVDQQAGPLGAEHHGDLADPAFLQPFQRQRQRPQPACAAAGRTRAGSRSPRPPAGSRPPPPAGTRPPALSPAGRWRRSPARAPADGW